MENPFIVTIGLAGNPNTGKSTVFNCLTGLKQHTGNWSGKTVINKEGYFEAYGRTFRIVDLPGIYSLQPRSEDEQAAVRFIENNEADVLVILIDATCLERSLILAVQILSTSDNAIICLNMMDEAAIKGIEIDSTKLSEILNTPVVESSARSYDGIDDLKSAMMVAAQLKTVGCRLAVYDLNDDFETKMTKTIRYAEHVAKQVVKVSDVKAARCDRLVDSIMLTRRFGIPFMLLMLTVVFWLTIIGSNYPSEVLRKFFAHIEMLLNNVFYHFQASEFLRGLIVDGVYKTTAWVVAVMLPPMSIFFPLFALLEDAGILPRIAFMLDGSFKKAGMQGKQALSMWVGNICKSKKTVISRFLPLRLLAS